MNIQYYGDYCFKITTKPAGRATEDVVIWTDLPVKSTGVRTPFGHADLVLLSHLDPSDEALSGLKDDPVIIHTPGEYAARGVSVLGFPSYRDSDKGANRGQNTILVFDTEEVRIAYLGALGHGLDNATVEKIGDVDILFVPVGGGDALSTKDAEALIHDIEPKIVVPMHYLMAGVTVDASGPEEFRRSTNCKISEDTAKLNFKKKDLDGKSMEVVFLSKS
ncbi:MAG TPA: MBL fold metallo-hydrolase [Candidatus Fimivivens sp.]|nr:MBL fold metallo-hydrolase [Candidatus Fimivivens sp.]